MKYNVVVFLLKVDAIELLRDLSREYYHAIKEIGPRDRMTNEDICRFVKDKIMHRLTLAPELREKIESVIIYSGIEAPSPGEAEERVKYLPPVVGWEEDKIATFTFPYVDVVIDPPLNKEYDVLGSIVGVSIVGAGLIVGVLSLLGLMER